MAQLNLLTDVEMLAELRRLLDEQTSADSTWDDTDLYSWLTRSNLRHFKMMLRADDNWFMATTTLTTSAQTVNYEDFTVPTDMYKVLRLWRMDDNDNTTKNYLVPVIRPINESPRGTFFGRPDIGYYQHNDGTDRKLRLVYNADVPASDVYTLEYTKMPNEIVSGAGSNCVVPVGMEEVVIGWAAWKAASSKGDDITLLTNDYNEELRQFRRDIKAAIPGEDKRIPLEWGVWDMIAW